MEHIGVLVEISEQTVIELIKGQATVAQSVADLKNSLDKSIPYLVKKDEENAAAIRSVEHKIWYFGGAGSVLGAVISHVGQKILGGK